jgi:hypothetical protein
MKIAAYPIEKDRGLIMDGKYFQPIDSDYVRRVIQTRWFKLALQFN